MNSREREESLTLGILETIDGQSNVSQRHLAERLGVALGLTNSYLKRCVRKGLIKIEQAPANRYLYYLTPRGFAEKSRLTAEYLTSSFDFYRRASSSCTKVFQECRQQGAQRILLCGVSEFAEIASLRAREQGVQIVGILDRESSAGEAIGISVHANLDDCPPHDACVITSIKAEPTLLEYLGGRVAQDRIFIPDILGIKPNK